MKHPFRLLSLAVAACLTVLPLAAAKELTLFAWSEYVPAAVLDKFTAETGIKVNYETYASNEEMLAKLLAGGAGYDLIQPSEYAIESLVKAKKLAPLDLKKIPNLKNLGKEYLHLPHDPEQKFSVPYMVGTVGIVVNTAKVKDPVKGYADVFSGKYRNRLVVLDDGREVVSWALSTLGTDINDITPATLAKARPVIAKWLPQVKLFDSDSPKTALINGEADIGIVWSGEAAALFKHSPKFKYVLPAEGAHMFIDSLAIPADAPHKAEAMAFINFILRPDISVLISADFPYTNPNLEARKQLSAEDLANPASYPPVGKLATFRDIGKAAADVDQLFTELKEAK